MKEVEILESDLRSQKSDGMNARAIEIKIKIKKALSNSKVLELLNRLEIKGQPVWGLSMRERDFVRAARKKYIAG